MIYYIIYIIVCFHIDECYRILDESDDNSFILRNNLNIQRNQNDLYKTSLIKDYLSLSNM